MTHPGKALAPPRGRAVRDALVAGVVVLAGGLVFTRLDAVESVTGLLTRFEGFELDDWLLTSGLAVAAATWFALRRLADSERRLRALEQSDAANARYAKRLEQLSAQLLETEQRERERLAEALHDSVSQTLYACGLQLDRARSRAEEDKQREQTLSDARELLELAMARTRDLTTELSPPILHDLGLYEAIGWLLEQSNARFAIDARLVPGESWARIPVRWHAPVFHSVKELVINAGKHSGSSAVQVSAETAADGAIRVCVLDEGCGFAVGQIGRGFGLFSVERRMACMGAELRIESAPEAGTRATLVLPNAARLELHA